MPKAVITFSERTNRVINVVKAMHGLRNKSDAIEQIVALYEEELLEPEFRPEFVNETLEAMKEPSKSISDLSELLDWTMAWRLEAKPRFEREYRRLARWNPAFRRDVERKIQEILLDPLRFKPLRGPLKGLRRVHVHQSFVLLYQADPRARIVKLVRITHHDHAYQS